MVPGSHSRPAANCEGRFLQRVPPRPSGISSSLIYLRCERSRNVQRQTQVRLRCTACPQVTAGQAPAGRAARCRPRRHVTRQIPKGHDSARPRAACLKQKRRYKSHPSPTKGEGGKDRCTPSYNHLYINQPSSTRIVCIRTTTRKPLGRWRHQAAGLRSGTARRQPHGLRHHLSPNQRHQPWVLPKSEASVVADQHEVPMRVEPNAAQGLWPCRHR